MGNALRSSIPSDELVEEDFLGSVNEATKGGGGAEGGEQLLGAAEALHHLGINLGAAFRIRDRLQGGDGPGNQG